MLNAKNDTSFRLDQGALTLMRCKLPPSAFLRRQKQNLVRPRVLRVGDVLGASGGSSSSSSSSAYANPNPNRTLEFGHAQKMVTGVRLADECDLYQDRISGAYGLGLGGTGSGTRDADTVDSVESGA